MQCIGQRRREWVRVWATAMVALLALAGPQTALAQVCPFDDGNSSLAVEGLILTRYALGITGAPLVASTDINAVDAPTVEATINCPSCGLNITGNPTLTVADATIISRKLAGFGGAALTNGLSLGSGTRNTVAAVNSFLLAGCGASGGTVTSITAGTDVGQYTSIAVPADGLPVISYYDVTNLDLKVAKCTIASCGAFSPPVTVDGTGGANVGKFTSIAIGANGFPVIAYFNDSSNALKVAKCVTAGCVGSFNVINAVDNAGVSDAPLSIKVPADGRPVISYGRNDGLRVVKCGDANCGSGNVNSVVDSGVGFSSTGGAALLVPAADGLPVIAYGFSSNYDLKVVKCSNSGCANP